MRRNLPKSLITLLLVTAATFASPFTFAQDRFSLCWSIYVGWMPWEYGDATGIIDKWADKYDMEIDVVQINDYIESINQYTAGQFDACAMTSMDALTIPAAGGVDSTALIVGDFSNGNDAVILKEGATLSDIKGQRVNLVELSVSHYLLARGLESVGLSERDVTVVNTSDADMVAAYSTRDVTAITTWNPLVNEILKVPGATKVFDSTQIPGEILDTLMVKTEVLEANPDLGKALVGAWYEIMSAMESQPEVRAHMGEASGTDLAGYEAQLATTQMFYSASDAVAFVKSPQLMTTMEYVANFSFEQGLLGEGAADAGFIGIQTPSGVFGNSRNIKLRFDPSYMEMAADGSL
ncbi:MAG: putative urea ABC transporter substrate-binding protein [Gammaproteobacteria bacterium]